MRRLEAGEVVVRRDVYRGRVWSAAALVVLDDSPDELVAVRAPGSPWMGVPGYPGFDRQKEGFTTGEWALTAYEWRGTYALNRVRPDRHHTVIHLFDASSHEFICWYVNFERPHVRDDDPAAYDTLDLMLDLVVFPDRSVLWKDEEHWMWAIDAGIFDPADIDAVDHSRNAIESDARAGRGDFDGRWTDWRPGVVDLPTLPAGWDRPGPPRT